MNKSISRFLMTTALVRFPAHTKSSDLRRPMRFHGITFENVVMSGFGAGIVRSIPHRAPRLTGGIMRQFEMDQPEYITRHIEECFLSSALRGYFQFGTLVSYRAQEGAISGRLGDHQESRIQEIFNSRSGLFENAEFPDVKLVNTSIVGGEKQVIVETVVNDFCSCSSIGEFSLERAAALRDREDDPDKKPGAYVTYHLPTLKLALENFLSKSPNVSGLTLLGRKVKYGEKDRVWEVERNFTYQRERDAIAIWLSIAFVKSPVFEHEQEYRLLLLDPSGPGGLDFNEVKYVIEQSGAIAASIVASGIY